MAKEIGSLLAGRNQTELSSDEIRRATNTFLGLDNTVNTRYDPKARTVFHVCVDEVGAQYGEIVFGPDIYPGRSVVDPNAALSLNTAAAHELTHYHRWKDKIALPGDSMEHLDEALTSLQAIMRYERHLSDPDVRQLISDAIQRLQLYLNEVEGG
ncbi:MAG: hypothetical protein MUP30_00735 [Deltaproteobacteria bacterium]|nr:hypothetical protein [Deltaproteobacteria bacterium]